MEQLEKELQEAWEAWNKEAEAREAAYWEAMAELVHTD